MGKMVPKPTYIGKARYWRYSEIVNLGAPKS